MKYQNGLWGMPWPLVVVLAFAIGMAGGTWLGVLTTLKGAEDARERYKAYEITCPVLPPPSPVTDAR